MIRSGVGCRVFGSPFTFTGELLDANDLLYLRARYYSPALGVFTGLDPVENDNRYQYASANPVNALDPSGKFAMSSSLNYKAELASLMNEGLCAFSSPRSTDWLDWCDERRNDIIRALNKLYNRIKDMLEDPCREYETYHKIPFDQGVLPQDCLDRRKVKTWDGHQQSAKETQRQADRLRNGFNNRGCSDPDDEINDTVDEWTNVDIDSLMPDRQAEDEGIDQGIPPKPDLNLMEGVPCDIMIQGICVMPIFIIS